MVEVIFRKIGLKSPGTSCFLSVDIQFGDCLDRSAATLCTNLRLDRLTESEAELIQTGQLPL
jgi:hypothetical protein